MYQNHANSPTMRDLENQIAAAVESGEVVDLRVTPVYVGDEPVARGVTIDAHGNNGTSIYQTVLNQPKK